MGMPPAKEMPPLHIAPLGVGGQAIPVPDNKRYHRVACNNMANLRRRHEGVALKDMPRAFLNQAFGAYAREVSDSESSYIFVSDQLGSGPASPKQGRRGKAKGKLRASILLNSLKKKRSFTDGSVDFEDMAGVIESTWAAQRTVPFEDTIYVIMLSPKDPDDYIALGDRRLYWLDDDVATKEHTKGLLHAIDYFDGFEKGGVGLPGGIAPAPDGREWRRSEEGAALKSYFFRMSRQFDVVADGGDVSDIWPLPYRCKERGYLEAARVCLLLNDLREFLHPGSTKDVMEKAAHCEQYLHLRIVTANTLKHHLLVAEQHGRNCRLLDEDGQPHKLFKNLDGPPPYGIQYQLGTGTTAYLHMLFYLGWGFLIASILSIPHLYLNATGGYLNDLGFVSSYYEYIGSFTLSIAASRPWERHFIYPVFDVLIFIVLALSFMFVKRALRRPPCPYNER